MSLPANQPVKFTLRFRVVATAAAVAFACALVHYGTQPVVQIEAGDATASVARFRLEKHTDKFYRVGSAVPFTGWVTDHFENGRLRLRTAVVDGKLHGESTGWYADGTVELLEHFEKGEPHGSRATWHANGQKRSEGRLIWGKQQGMYRQWDEDGKLVTEAEFDGGKPHGLSRAWHPDGSLKAEALMNHGEVQTRNVYPDGARWEPALLAGNSKR